jgi:hypothetical protein
MRTSSHLRRPISCALGLLALAVAAAACGGSSGKSSTAPSSAALSAAPSASADLSAYEHDLGGIGTTPTAWDAGYTPRYDGDEVFDELPAGYAMIEQGLPKATDLSQVATGEPADLCQGTALYWEPNGRRDTLLPPGAPGERIYKLALDFDAYFQGGDVTARISFISRAEGDALSSDDSSATLAVPPTKVYSYRLDKATAAALGDYFWVKEAPTPSDSAES